MKYSIFRLPRIIAMLALTLVTACVHTYDKPPSEEDRALQFEPAEGLSTLYIYRSEGFADKVKVPILLNGNAVAQTSARSFFVLQLAPGVHTLVSQTSNAPSLTLMTEPGKNYYIWQELKVGLMSPRSKLHEVSEEKGKAQVMRCRLLKGYL